MIGVQPKRVDPETGKVLADYSFSDIKYQRQWLLQFVNAVNSQRGEHEPKLDAQKIVQKCMNRISRYYGYQNKYDGSGNLREGLAS